MARRGQRYAAAIPGEPSDPTSWRSIVDTYLLSLELRELSPATVYGRRRALARLAAWSLARHITTPLAVDATVIDAYRLHLHHRTTAGGTPLTTRTKQQYLIATRGLYRWLDTPPHPWRRPRCCSSSSPTGGETCIRR